MVTLINKEKRMRVFNLDHPTFADRATIMNMIVVEEARDGRRLPRRIRKSVCGSLTLLPKEKKHGLPDQIIKVPQIDRAIKEGSLAFLKVSEVQPTTTATTKPTRRSRKRANQE